MAHQATTPAAQFPLRGRLVGMGHVLPEAVANHVEAAFAGRREEPTNNELMQAVADAQVRAAVQDSFA